MKLAKYFLTLLVVSLVTNYEVHAASASRSLFSRAIASARNHPIMTAAGVVGTGYLLYKWFHKKRAARPLPVILPAPVLDDQPDNQVRNPADQEMSPIKNGRVMVAAQYEKDTIHDVLYDVAPNLPEEMLSLIMDYHQPAFRGKEVHNFGNEAGRPYAFIALPGNRFASGHDHGVIQIWNAKTKECVKRIELGVDFCVHSFCRLDDTRLLVCAESNKRGLKGHNLYLVDMNSFEITLADRGSFYQVSSMIPLSDHEVLIGKNGSESPRYMNIQTKEIYDLWLPVDFNSSPGVENLGLKNSGDSSYVIKIDENTVAIGVGGGPSHGWIGLSDVKVLQNAIESFRDELRNDPTLNVGWAAVQLLEKEDFKLVMIGHRDPHCMTVLHDKKLATGSWVGKLSVWDYGKGVLLKTVRTFEDERTIQSIVEFPDNSIIVATGRNVRAFSRDDQGNITSLREYEGTAPLLFLPQGLLTGDSRGAIRLVE